MKEQIDALARLMLETFRARTDRIGVTTPRDLRRNIVGGTSLRVAHEGDILKNLILHLKGEKRVAFYNLVSANSCTWAVIEFGPAPDGPQTAPSVDSRALVEKLRSLGVAAYREISKSGPGNYSVWVFFAENPMARRIRSLLLGALKSLSIASLVEVSPRQDVTDGLGQYVWLPLFGGRDKWTHGPGRDVEEYLGVRDECTVFVDDEGTPFPSQANFLLGIQRNSAEAIEKAIRVVGPGLDLAKEKGDASQGDFELLPFADSAALSHLLRKCKKIGDLYGAQRREGLSYDSWFKVVSVLVALGQVGVEEAIAFSKMGPGYRQGSDEEMIREMRRRHQEGGERPAACAEFPCDLDCFEGKPLVKWAGGEWREDSSPREDGRPLPCPVWFVKQYYYGLQKAPAARGAPASAPPVTPVASAQAQAQAPAPSGDLREILGDRDAPIAVHAFAPAPGKGEGLNRVLGGGFQRGELVLLDGWRGIGKTAFALQIADGIAAENAARRDRGDGVVAVLYVSLAEGRKHLKLKTLSRLAGVEVAALRSGGRTSGELMDRLMGFQAEYQKFSGYLTHVDLGMHRRDTMKPSDIVEYLAERKKALDAETALVVVDPIELLYTGRERLDARVETRAARAAEELAVLALRENVAVLALTSGRLGEAAELPAACVLSLRAEEDMSDAGDELGRHARLFEEGSSAMARARTHLAEAVPGGAPLEGAGLAVLVPLKLRWTSPSYPVYRHVRAFHRFWEVTGQGG